MEAIAAASESAGTAEGFENYSLYVLNAGAGTGQAGAVGDYLTDEGMNVADVSNAMDGVYWESQIVTADPADPAAQQLAERLGNVPVTANANVEPGSLIVVIAADYAGPAMLSPEEREEVPSEAPVGTPGEDFGAAETGPEITAGGNGPRCVN